VESVDPFIMSGNVKEKRPEFVRLMDASREQVLDMVATEYEDSFCLESFGDLIESAEAAEGKHIDVNVL
jgi:anti-anti-sigma regulatory factor